MAQHDAWFRRQVEGALEEANQPEAEWIDNATALDRVRRRIAETDRQRMQGAR